VTRGFQAPESSTKQNSGNNDNIKVS